MHSRLEIFELLNAPPRGIFIQDVRMEQFGKHLLLTCLYDPEVRKPFTLVFEKCKNIHWELVDDDFLNNVEELADVIGMFLGNEFYGSPAIIHTDLFEIVITYERKRIQKDW